MATKNFTNQEIAILVAGLHAFHEAVCKQGIRAAEKWWHRDIAAELPDEKSLDEIIVGLREKTERLAHNGDVPHGRESAERTRTIALQVSRLFTEANWHHLSAAQQNICRLLEEAGYLKKPSNGFVGELINNPPLREYVIQYAVLDMLSGEKADRSASIQASSFDGALKSLYDRYRPGPEKIVDITGDLEEFDSIQKINEAEYWIPPVRGNTVWLESGAASIAIENAGTIISAFPVGAEDQGSVDCLHLDTQTLLENYWASQPGADSEIAP